MPTWISKSRETGFQVIPYFAESTDPDDPMHNSVKKLERSIKRNEMVNNFHLNAVRRVRSIPSKYSKEISELSETRKVSLDPEKNWLKANIPDSIATVGLSTILAMKFALENFCFDFLVRTNTSSYVDLPRLQELIVHNKAENHVYAQTGSWGQRAYPSGALYVLPRQLVQQAVVNYKFWIHDYIDDVSIGLLLDLKRNDLVHVPRFEFTANTKLESLESKESFTYGLPHYRCKGNTPLETIANMLTVHNMTSGI